jgi:hypothetical protein
VESRALLLQGRSDSQVLFDPMTCATTLSYRPAGEDLVGPSAEQERVGALESLADERRGLVVEQRRVPFEALESAVRGFAPGGRRTTCASITQARSSSITPRSARWTSSTTP